MPISASHMPVRLAQAAFELFAQRGFAQVNLDQIAERAGVTKGSLYHHYENKKQLILAGCQRYYQQYLRQVNRTLTPLTDPGERLEAVLRLSVRTCVSDRQNRQFTTDIFALSLSDDEVRQSWAQFYDAVREMYIGLLEAAIAAGQSRAHDARRATDLMLAAIEGVKQRASFEPQAATPTQQRRIVEDLLSMLDVESKRPTAASKKR